MTPCTDAFPATWIQESPRPWDALVTLGPAGFPAYARLRFMPDPAHPGQRESEAADSAVDASETERLRRAVSVLTPFTTTAQRCYFLLWDGWGAFALDRDGTAAAAPEEGAWRQADVAALPAPHPGAVFEPGVQPHQPPRHRLQAPLVQLPDRDYHLFQGAVADLGDWGPAVPLRWPEEAPVPAFIWPADRAWCLTRDVDPHYAGIGAAPAAIDALLHHPGLDVVPADPAVQQPHYQ